jgi:uncharacterized low-complexity protein
MFRRMILPLVLCAALVMAVFGGAFASAKPVDSKSAKTQSCFKVAKFTKADSGSLGIDDVCAAGKFVTYKNYRGAQWGSGRKRAWVTQTKFESTNTLVPCSEDPGPPNPDCTVGFMRSVGHQWETCHTAKNVVIKRVILVQWEKDKIILKPMKHTQHSCSAVLTYDNKRGAVPLLRIDSAKG